jgi:hypothetical protein
MKPCKRTITINASRNNCRDKMGHYFRLATLKS